MAVANPAEITFPAIPAIPRRAWPLLAVFGVAVYLIGFDQGALVDPIVRAITSSPLVHEFVHDGRHLLGFPCH